jgi:hypothetical protein
MRAVVIRHLHRHPIHTEQLSDERTERLHRPAELATEHRPQPVGLVSDARSSISTPRRQLPSLITFGVSIIAATVRPLTSTPSTSSASTWNSRKAFQRARSAPKSSDTVHGHDTSQEQFSKYWPSSFHAMPSSSLACTDPRLVAPPRVKSVVAGRPNRQPAGRKDAEQPRVDRCGFAALTLLAALQETACCDRSARTPQHPRF